MRNKEAFQGWGHLFTVQAGWERKPREVTPHTWTSSRNTLIPVGSQTWGGDNTANHEKGIPPPVHTCEPQPLNNRRKKTIRGVQGHINRMTKYTHKHIHTTARYTFNKNKKKHNEISDKTTEIEQNRMERLQGHKSGWVRSATQMTRRVSATGRPYSRPFGNVVIKSIFRVAKQQQFSAILPGVI